MSSAFVSAKEFKIDGVFRQAMVGSLGSLDPTGKMGEVQQRVLENMQETLLALDPATGNVIPRAAEAFEVSSDGLTLTFTLRPDLYFSNGDKVTAQDYAFALRRHLDPVNQSAYLTYVSHIRGAVELMEGMFYHPEKVGIAASLKKGKQVLTIRLVRPSPGMLYFFAHVASSPLHKASVEKDGSRHFTLGQMHASGPFIGVEKSNKLLVFAKNPHYKSKKTIQLKQAQLHLFDTREKAEKAFLHGRVDQFGTREYPASVNMVEKLKGSDVLFYQPDLRTVFIRFHTRRVPTGEFKIRQALSMAINRDEIAQLALTNGERKAYALTPDLQHLYDPPHTYYFDIEGAKNILRQSGFCLGQKTELCIDLPTIDIMFPASLLSQKVVLLIQAQWQALGFQNIGLQSVTNELFLTRVSQGHFTAALDEIAVDTFHFFDLLHSFESSQSTSVGVQSKHFDELVRAASQKALWPDSMSQYRQAEGLLLRDASVIPLFQTTIAFVKAIYVKGYEANLWDVHLWKDISIQ